MQIRTLCSRTPDKNKFLSKYRVDMSRDDKARNYEVDGVSWYSPDGRSIEIYNENEGNNIQVRIDDIQMDHGYPLTIRMRPFIVVIEES